MVVLVTDFLVPDGWAERLRSLGRRHEVIAVRLEDPREVDMPDIGVVTFEDPETGAQLTVDTGDARLRERFRAAAEQTVHADRRDAAVVRRRSRAPGHRWRTVVRDGKLSRRAAASSRRARRDVSAASGRPDEVPVA